MGESHECDVDVVLEEEDAVGGEELAGHLQMVHEAVPVRRGSDRLNQEDQADAGQDEETSDGEGGVAGAVPDEADATRAESGDMRDVAPRDEGTGQKQEDESRSVERAQEAEAEDERCDDGRAQSRRKDQLLRRPFELGADASEAESADARADDQQRQGQRQIEDVIGDEQRTCVAVGLGPKDEVSRRRASDHERGQNRQENG